MRARVWLIGVVGTALVLALALWHFGLGWGSIHAAARKGDAKALKGRLAMGISPNRRHLLSGDTPLIEAARRGHLDAVKVLVEGGANVNLQGEAWYGPLHCAAYGGHLETVKYLLEHGASVRVFEGHDRPLNSAAQAGHLQVAKVLLEHGADINAQGVDGGTPLENAVSCGHVEMVKFLLAKGAQVNTRANYGRTPLHVAAWNDNVVLGRLLLEHGADPALECNGHPVEGRSPQFRELLGSVRRTPNRQ
jgi:ankyrin repeat protein